MMAHIVLGANELERAVATDKARFNAKLKAAKGNREKPRKMLASLVIGIKDGKSFQDLSKETGIAVSTLERWASGDVTKPHEDQLTLLAKYLEVSVGKLHAMLHLSKTVDEDLFATLSQPLADPAGILTRHELGYVGVLRHILANNDTAPQGRQSAVSFLRVIQDIVLTSAVEK